MLLGKHELKDKLINEQEREILHNITLNFQDELTSRRKFC